MTKEELTKTIAPMLKSEEFKKSKFTWRRNVSDGIQVFNIQGSQFSSAFYLNVGFYISDLGDKKTPSENKCHIRQRLKTNSTPTEIAENILNWFREFGSVSKLAENLEVDSLPPATLKIAKNYILQHNKTLQTDASRR